MLLFKKMIYASTNSGVAVQNLYLKSLPVFYFRHVKVFAVPVLVYWNVDVE